MLLTISEECSHHILLKAAERVMISIGNVGSIDNVKIISVLGYWVYLYTYTMQPYVNFITTLICAEQEHNGTPI